MSEIVDTEFEESNLNIYVPKRKNKKSVIPPLDINTVDINLYKKLLEKETKRKQKVAELQQDGEKREKHLAYLREYAKQNRNPEKEKEYYENNKEKIAQKSKLNMRKYITFYKMYKDKHPEFIKEWDEKKLLNKDSE